MHYKTLVPPSLPSMLSLLSRLHLCPELLDLDVYAGMREMPATNIQYEYLQYVLDWLNVIIILHCIFIN